MNVSLWFGTWVSTSVIISAMLWFGIKQGLITLHHAWKRVCMNSRNRLVTATTRISLKPATKKKMCVCASENHKPGWYIKRQVLAGGNLSLVSMFFLFYFLHLNPAVSFFWWNCPRTVRQTLSSNTLIFPGCKSDPACCYLPCSRLLLPADEATGYGPVFEEQPVDTIYPEESPEAKITMSCRARATPPATYK